MAIVRKTFKDIVPKHIMCLMVNKMKVFIEIELMPSLYGAGNPVGFIGICDYVCLLLENGSTKFFIKYKFSI